MTIMPTTNPRIEDLTRLRVWYRHRGPRDGRAGIQPDGLLGTAWAYDTAAVVLDAQRVMEMDDPTLNRWREGMGLNDPIKLWSDQCPARGPVLTHARAFRDPPGVCIHCHAQIGAR